MTENRIHGHRIAIFVLIRNLSFETGFYFCLQKSLISYCCLIRPRNGLNFT
eukprot:UN12554